jgi:hypothetical protein
LIYEEPRARNACHEPKIRSSAERAKMATRGCLPFAALVKRLAIELVLLWAKY